MDGVNKLVDTILQAIDEKIARMLRGKTEQASVIRTEGDTVWVHIPGGPPETPVQKTIECRQDDTVEVRIENGTATLTGNLTSPPTDDKKAEEAEKVAKAAKKIAEQAEDEASGTSQYFWYLNGQSSEAGAHVTEIPQEEFVRNPQGGNLLMRTEGIAVREGTKELATMTKDGFDAKTYDSSDNEVVITHLGYGPGTDSGGGTSDAPYYDLGVRTGPVGNYSVCEGQFNTASGYESHAEGGVNTASGSDSHCEGASNTASGLVAHCEGGMNTASGGESHCEGFSCEASGICSHAGGYGTIADQPHQTAIGKYNTANNTNNLFVVGNGTAGYARSNAFEVSDTGDVKAAGELMASNIGDRREHSPAATSCQTGKWYQVAYLKLPVGTWMVDCNAYFPATNATGTRQIFITNATSEYNNVTIAPASIGNITRDALVGANMGQYPQCHFSLVVDTETTIRLEAYQGSGSTMNVTGRMLAVRIK